MLRYNVLNGSLAINAITFHGKKKKSLGHCVLELERDPWILGIQWWIQIERRDAVRHNVQTKDYLYISFSSSKIWGKKKSSS